MITTSCSERPDLPVGKIVAVGRNYLDHAREMGAERPAQPLLFLKPATALHFEPAPLRLPTFSNEVQHEVELVVRLGQGGGNLNLADAARAPDAYGLGLDLTARDLQKRAKERGEPWACSKGFDGAAPLSQLMPLGEISELADLELALEVNGVLRQKVSTAAMLFSVPELVAFVSTRFRWEPGDLLFTGTPAGVGPVQPGDHLVARLGEITLDLGVDQP